VKLFLRHNYDLDMPCKLDYDGSGGKLPVRVAVERDLAEIQRLLARVGYVFSVPGAASPAAGAAAASGPPTATGTTDDDEPGGAGSVRSLRLQCRRQIRRLLGFGISAKADALPLPVSLKNFILLKDLLDD